MREVGRVAAAGFSVGAGEGPAVAESSGAAAVTTVGLGLLAIQEGGDRAARDRGARQRAGSILEELRRLQLDLLRDGPDTSRLERLASLQIGEAAADPLLQEAVEAIVLRARVEMARRGWNATVSAR